MERITDRQFANEMRILWKSSRDRRMEIRTMIRNYFLHERAVKILQHIQDPIEK